jgi:formylglycine-generating enzyme required for sulfatase activity
MIEIPAGEFIYQDSQKTNLGTFWIDEYEVTLGQYARFLRYLDKHVTEATKFDHPNQPRNKSHVPLNWDIYYGRASSSFKKYRAVKFVPIDLNCPAILVDWWDAYAYAKWKGRRLPTEQEWEKAARGTKGFLYPWGNDFDPKKCNSSADFNENPGPGFKAQTDGFVWWAPVDAIKTDKSPFGVIGMAGNVSEWTDSWDEAHTYPVIRGGNYHSPDNKLTKRFAKLDAEGTTEYLGFRTASDTKPK